jgi:isoquinoline 1-oxidoreductase beta subunit
MKPTRRTVLGALVSGTGFLVATTLPGCNTDSTVPALSDPETGTFLPNAWIRITPEDEVTFILDRIEMGQGVMTSHAQIVAEELMMKPDALKIKFARVDRRYENADLGYQITGASTSTHSSWHPLRAAASSTREALAEAAAASMGVPRAELILRDGTISHPGTGKQLRYGDCAADAHRFWTGESKPLKEADYTVIGTSFPRLDLPAKVRGEAKFGLDSRQPGMLCAVLVRAPVVRARRTMLDIDEALLSPGVIDVVELSRSVAVVAEGYWAARRAAPLVKVEWDAKAVSDEGIQKMFEDAAADYGRPVIDTGDALSSLKSADTLVEATYSFPYLAHATMEPQNCSARVADGRCEIWAPTQSPGAARRLAAQITGLDEENIEVHATFLGGGFGRRISQDYVAEAVELAMKLGRGVQVIWSREDDIQNDIFRPGSYHVARAGVKDGQVSGWYHRIVSPSILGYLAPQFIGNRYVKLPTPATYLAGKAHRGGPKLDETSTEGADQVPYRIDDLLLEYSYADPGIPIGFWRSVGHSTNAFVVETMIDELAVAAGADPFTFRRDLLQDSPRHRQVLEVAAEKAGWGDPLPAGVFRGIAQHHSYGSFVGEVVEASVEDGKIRVHRVVVAVDCGKVINPDIIKAQLQGATVFGLTAALKGHIHFQDGRVQESNFHDYPLLRMSEMPQVEVHIVHSDEDPTGIGEPGVPVVAPALANALFQATGQRIRQLPMKLA